MTTVFFFAELFWCNLIIVMLCNLTFPLCFLPLWLCFFCLCLRQKFVQKINRYLWFTLTLIFFCCFKIVFYILHQILFFFFFWFCEVVISLWHNQSFALLHKLRFSAFLQPKKKVLNKSGKKKVQIKRKKKKIFFPNCNCSSIVCLSPNCCNFSYFSIEQIELLFISEQRQKKSQFFSKNAKQTTVS